VWWTAAVEKMLNNGETTATVLKSVEKWLSLLSDSVLREQPAIRRKKIESLVEFISNITLYVKAIQIHIYRLLNLSIRRESLENWLTMRSKIFTISIG
jgi:hypothetical protein